MGDRSQLNIACWINSRSRLRQIYEGLHVCYQALQLGGGGYERYNLSFDCGSKVAPHLFISGTRFREAIERGESAEECAVELIEGNLLWFDAHPLRGRLDQWHAIWQVSLPEGKKVFRERLLKSGFSLLGEEYSIRHVEEISADRFRRVKAHVVLRQSEMESKRLLEIVQHVVRRLQRRLTEGEQAFRRSWVRRTPDYVWICLYSRDRRVRRLLSMGWRDDELLLHAESISAWNNTGPVFVKQPDIVWDNIRLKFNPRLYPP